jgi:decaprenylphospho-beta-D-ribofuranose 2-oxidase
MLSGWGRVPVPGREVRSEDLEALTRDAVLCRGLGRSYGDSSLPPPGQPVVAGTPLADRILAFDASTGVLRAEAGFSLFELNRLFLPRRFCAPVAPGTQFITLGGMVAADVHGKNHHRDGCFGRHVLGLRMRVADGSIVECSPEKEGDLFRATLGGMGLTGHILEVTCRLMPIPSPWIWRESERIGDIDRFIEALKEAGPRWPYTMGWIDCLSRGRGMGRGILSRGRWAEPGEAPRDDPRPLARPTVPFVLPRWVISRATVTAFNTAYYHWHPRRTRRGIQHPESFLYPLDVIRHWNRLYGPRGFTQYQCVLPDSAGHGAARRFLELLTGRGGASMLCVIKDCGEQGAGLLSFPRPGISIALDIPIRDDTQSLVDALNELVIGEGGRIYLAKDAFTRPEHFRAMEPRLPEWSRIRERWDPQRRLRSAQSVRVFGDRP